MFQACKSVWSRGGVAGLYQGLIPWVCAGSSQILMTSNMKSSILQAWIEASTKGAVLIFTASEVETATLGVGINPAFAGLLGGMSGGIAQAYATMGQYSLKSMK
jgi:hypothetical protein